MEEPSAHLSPGTRLQSGKYSIVSGIGQGGFGITYRGILFVRHKESLGAINLKEKVAIKEFFFQDYCTRKENSHEISISTTKGKEIFDRFREKLIKEARILAQLNHPYIVNVLEVFEENNTVYMVMEYIEGESLRDRLEKEKKLLVDQALKYIRQVGEALTHIHEKRILHLDVKPSNILIASENDQAMLIDFGISKRYDESFRETSLTLAGKSKGYAPIEQSSEKGAAMFAPSLDVYSLGATLYHCLTGCIPPDSTDILEEGLTPPVELNRDIPESLNQAIMKAMALRKADRYQSIVELLNALKPKKNKAIVHSDEDATDHSSTAREINSYSGSTEPDADPKHIVNEIQHEPPPSNDEPPVIEMVYVEGGTFQMGSNDGDGDEKPVHTVTLDGFYIAKYPVTQKQWRAVMGSNPSYFSGCDNCPVESVSWNEVQEFIRKLNQMTGKQYRLPTEAQWEFAARGGNKSRGYIYSGSNTIGEVTWYWDKPGSKTHPVGQKKPNELGIYDMSGNVWEWCADRYNGDYYANSPRYNPENKTATSYYPVGRGGSWHSKPGGCRATRRRHSPVSPNFNLGFRLVKME